jgi:eukaryotic-like serine/threonine-protein kinase
MVILLVRRYNREQARPPYRPSPDREAPAVVDDPKCLKVKLATVLQAANPSRDLLFGLFALQNGLIDQSALVAAFHAWTRDKGRPLADHLVTRGDLDADRCGVIEALVDLHLKKHGGSTEQSLAAIDAGPSIRESLARIGDPGIDATLARVGSGKTDRDVDPDRTASYAVGSATSDGQRFRVLRPHAQGGLGAVFVALDNELHREVALKQILDSHADDPVSRRRFLLEAEVTGGLEHPGIVSVHGLGTYADGRPYYAMRFIKGDSLKDVITAFHADETLRRQPGRRSLELRKLLRRFLDVCNAIEFAHSRGILHRDLKPSNVILGKHGETLVVDWGLAKALGRVESGSDTDERPLIPSSASGSAETLPGSALGTPAYMSPEQAAGELDRLGPPSDTYSLGASLYCILAGKPPFAGDVGDVLRAVQKGDFRPPRALNPTMHRALEAVCLKAMALRPADRYGSSKALAEDIEQWMADEPVSAYREKAPARLARWGRRHKPIVAGAAGLLITAVAALSAGIILLEQEQKKTESQRVLANAKSIEATQRAEALRRRDAVSRVNLAYREYLEDNVALADDLLNGCPADLRAWEWDYAHRLGHSELRTFPGSSQGRDVWSVAFCPDGELLAAGTGPWGGVGGSPTAELLVRSIKTGEPVFTVGNLTGAFQAVAFSPDGRCLAAARGFEGKETGAVITVFAVPSGQKVWESAERGLNILSLMYSPDGRTIAAGCGSFNSYTAIGYARLRDAATGAVLGEPIIGEPGGVLCVAFSPDGRQLALASRSAVDIYDVSSRDSPAIVHQLRGHVNFVYAVAFSPDGKHVATGGSDNTVRLWDRATGAPLQTLIGHRGFVRGLAFAPDGAHLVSGSEDKSVRRWDLTGGEDNAAFHGHTGFVHCVAFSPDGALATSGSLDGTVKLWPAATTDSQVTFRNSSGWVGTVAFAPDGRRVASAHNGNVRIWDPRTGEEHKRVIGPPGVLGQIGLAFSPDGKTLAVSGRDGSINVWDTATWVRRQVLTSQGAPVTDADFSPDSRLLATTAEDGTLRLWDLVKGTTAWSVPAHAQSAKAVRFAPDGRRLATAGNDQKAKVWDSATGREIAVFNGHATGVQDLAFSPDGHWITSVGGSYRGPVAAEVKVWKSATGEETASYQGHTGLVTAVAYFPDGKRLATASDDRTIKLWDVTTGEPVFTLRSHTSGVVSLAISRDGRQIVSGSIDHTAKTWSTLVAAEPTETAAELSRRRAAVERVQSLFARHLLKSEVLNVLRTDRTVSPPLRAAAIEIAERRTENASALYEAAWLTIVRPTGPPGDYRVALRQLEAACQVVTEDPVRLADYRRALALALIRAGQAAQALETIKGLGHAIASQARAPTPLDLAVTAIASARVGQKSQARDALDQLRRLVQTDRFANDQEALGFLHEAESVVEAPPKA